MDSLEETIKKNPLSRERVELILKTKVKKVIFWPMIATAFLYYCPPLNGYVVKINPRETKKEQKISLIHEFAHIAYNVVDGLEPPQLLGRVIRKRIQKIL